MGFYALPAYAEAPSNVNRRFAIPAGTGQYTIYTEWRFGGENLETHIQRATIAETGVFSEATTFHQYEPAF